MSLKKILFNPWFVTIGSTVASSIILKVIDFFVGTNIFDQVLMAIFKAIEFILNFLNQRISWGAILIIFFAWRGIAFLFKKRFHQKKTIIVPPYLDYTEDVFQGILYRWNYSRVNGKYKIGEIVAYCPVCKHRIVHGKCLRCTASFLIDRKDRLQREAMIRYGIETKYQINEFDEFGK